MKLWWTFNCGANDFEHRLKPKLLDIIFRKILGIVDFEIEVEYQAETIGKYDLGFEGTTFTLINKQTACLAQDQCGIPTERRKWNYLKFPTNQ
jgi:hypothetical protein